MTFGDCREFINNTNGIVTRPPPLKIGDFGDQSYPLRILRCKTNLDLNTCTGLKISDFGDYSEFINNTNGIVTRARPTLKLGDFGDQSYLVRILSLIKINFELNTYPGQKIGDFGDYSQFINTTNGIVTRGRPP